MSTRPCCPKSPIDLGEHLAWLYGFYTPVMGVYRALGQSRIAADHLQKACELEQIDDLGLGPTEQAYLSILAEGSSRLNVLASRLALPTRTVSGVVEQFLIRSGLVAKGHQGIRGLTAKGREHLL